MLQNLLEVLRLIEKPQVMTAPKHNVPARLFAACSYTALFNLLDFGAGGRTAGQMIRRRLL